MPILVCTHAGMITGRDIVKSGGKVSKIYGKTPTQDVNGITAWCVCVTRPGEKEILVDIATHGHKWHDRAFSK